MSEIVSTTGPNVEGEMLWCVHFQTSYYDDDPRMPGNVPVNTRVYVLAKGRDEAIRKAEPDIAKARAQGDPDADKRTEATIVTLEDLIPARDSSQDGNGSWYLTSKLSAVKLLPDDAKRYRLAVCLVPVE